MQVKTQFGRWHQSRPRALEERALGNPKTKCLLIGFHEEQSKASLIGAFMVARGVSRRRTVQIANF